jgi:hypothetical protein
MILRELVETYVATGEPVGSRTLSRRLPLGLSPATIRNAMADLEDAGLLYSPHTSAGRLPTERGLRLFVDGLLEFGALGEEERGAIAARCAASGRSLQETLGEAGQMLSGLAGAAGLVVAPNAEGGAVRHIEFVALGPGRALVVLVHDDGQVENRVIEVPPGLPPSALVQASNYLNARLTGRTLDEARFAVAGRGRGEPHRAGRADAAGDRGGPRPPGPAASGRHADHPARPGEAAAEPGPGARASPEIKTAVRAAGARRRRCCGCWTSRSAARACRSSSGRRAGCSTAPACRWWWRPSATGRSGSSVRHRRGRADAHQLRAGRSRWWTTRRG